MSALSSQGGLQHAEGRPARRKGGLRWARFMRSRAGMFGAVAFAFLVVISVTAPFIAPYSPFAQVSPPLLPPSYAHLLGTDELGRDILSRVIAGSTLSLAIAIGSALLAALIGTPVGIVAGYYGGLVDGVMMRLTDFILALPGILAALVIVVVLGSNALNLTIAIAIGASPVFARLARASTLEIKSHAFVRAARTMGAGPLDIMLRTIAPNVVQPLVVQLVVTASVAVLVTASLSFLGLGATPPTPSWGALLFDARSYLYDAPLYGIAPGMALAITVAAFDGIGKGLSEALGEGGGVRNSAGGMV